MQINTDAYMLINSTALKTKINVEPVHILGIWKNGYAYKVWVNGTEFKMNLE